MSDNFCSNCGETIIGQGACKKPGCKGKKSGDIATNDFGYPTIGELRVDLAAIFQVNQRQMPAIVPENIEEAVDWWLKMQEPHDYYDKPYRPKKVWVWPYADRLKYTLKRFLRLDSDFQGLIISAWEDGIFWRGDEKQFFMMVIDETLTFRETPFDEYKKRVREFYRGVRSSITINNKRKDHG